MLEVFVFDFDESVYGRRTVERYMHRPEFELYDLEKDPYEMHNLVDDPGSQGVLKEMEARVTGWMKRTGDSWKYDWHELVEDKGRLYNGGAYYSVDEYLQRR